MTQKKISLPQWLCKVNSKAKLYQFILLEELKRFKKIENKSLSRLFEREVTFATQLLNSIIKNCNDIQLMISRKKLATKALMQLCQEIHSDSVPKTWVSLTIDLKINLTNYIIDLQKRSEQLQKLSNAASYQSSGVWLGGLLFPEDYVTATRQFVALRNGWSLEELELTTEKHTNQALNEESFLMTGMRIEGGNWSKQNVIIPIDEKQQIGQSLPPMLMRWRKIATETLAADEMMVPVYLNRASKNLIMSLKLKCGQNKTTLQQKGISIILWTS